MKMFIMNNEFIIMIIVKRSFSQKDAIQVKSISQFVHLSGQWQSNNLHSQVISSVPYFWRSWDTRDAMAHGYIRWWCRSDHSKEVIFLDEKFALHFQCYGMKFHVLYESFKLDWFGERFGNCLFDPYKYKVLFLRTNDLFLLQNY